MQPVVERPPLGLGQLPEREEVTVVVKKTIVGMQGLGMHAVGQTIGHLRARDKGTVRTHADGVVFAQAPVLADPGAIDGHIAEDHRHPRASLPNLVATRSEILDQRLDFPQIAENITTDAELGENNDLRPCLPPLVNQFQHPPDSPPTGRDQEQISPTLCSNPAKTASRFSLRTALLRSMWSHSRSRK